jgi:hypothetical protein
MRIAPMHEWKGHRCPDGAGERQLPMRTYHPVHSLWQRPQAARPEERK